MRRNHILVIVVLGWALVLASLPGPGWAGERVVMKIGHIVDTKHPYHVGAEYFAKRLRELSNDRIEPQVYPNGQLGAEREMAEGIQFGTLESAAVTFAIASRF